MRARIDCELRVGKRSYRLYLDCEVDHTDVMVIDNKYVTVFCHNVSIDEKSSHKDYKKAFEITPDGDYHIMIEFMKNTEGIRIYSRYNEHDGPNLRIYISGEYKPTV